MLWMMMLSSPWFGVDGNITVYDLKKKNETSFMCVNRVATNIFLFISFIFKGFKSFKGEF